MPRPFDDRSLDRERLESLTQEEEKSQRWQSREPVREAQISIKGDARILDQFKRLCKDDRRTYLDMLRILIENFESNQNGR